MKLMNIEEVRRESASRRVPPPPSPARPPEPPRPTDPVAALDLSRPDRFDME